MLNRHVEIPAYLRVFLHRIENLKRKLRRIGVHKAYPLNSVDGTQLAKQLGQPAFAIQVDPIVG